MSSFASHPFTEQTMVEPTPIGRQDSPLLGPSNNPFFDHVASLLKGESLPNTSNATSFGNVGGSSRTDQAISLQRQLQVLGTMGMADMQAQDQAKLMNELPGSQSASIVTPPISRPNMIETIMQNGFLPNQNNVTQQQSMMMMPVLPNASMNKRDLDPQPRHSSFPRHPALSNPEGDRTMVSYTIHQAGRWRTRFEELVQFQREYGHCCVPSHWPQNAPLAQWVKRQRSQYKLKREGKHCNMTDERERSLTQLGFVWDSHAIFWDERLRELQLFRQTHGHSNVPTKYPENQQLAIWAKCQRRQFKLFTQGDSRSNMTLQRVFKLAKVGFVFNPRKLRRSNVPESEGDFSLVRHEIPGLKNLPDASSS